RDFSFPRQYRVCRYGRRKVRTDFSGLTPGGLRDIKLYKEQQKIIYYLDETWVITGISTTKVWQDKTIKSCSDARRKGLSTGLKGPSGKGGRLIITHVGSERGFVNDTADIFSSKKNKRLP
ncbi:hypothetical protein AVEN_75444-1, partial [Araneus ventricosus]